MTRPFYKPADSHFLSAVEHSMRCIRLG